MPRLSNEAHEAFAQTFVELRHFGKAAAAAGSEAENLSSAGISLYERPEIRARIRELSDKQLKPIQMNAQRVMVEIGRMATIRVDDFYHPDGSQKGVHELTEAQAACVKGFDRNGRFQFWDKMGATTLLAKHYKIVGDEGDGVNALASALADRLKAGRRRATPVIDSSADDNERLD